MLNQPALRRVRLRVISLVSAFTVGISVSVPVVANPASAAVPSLRQTNLYSPIVQNPTVSSRNFGSSVATNENGTRAVIGESGTTGTGSDAHVYECSASGCTFSTSLNALASRTVTITQYQVTGNKATVTTSSPHGFLPGEKITISGTGNTLFNVTNQVISDYTTNTIFLQKHIKYRSNCR